MTTPGPAQNLTDEALHAEAAKTLLDIRKGVAGDFDKAHERYDRWRRIDPFPDIQPALLNSADFCEYIVATGMMWPFNPAIEHIKTAALELRLAGTIVFWTDKGERVQREFKTGSEPFILCANSIAFVTLEPYLQIPEYIALRFNLRVSNVYRGLLLGTGPIIDPGYQGRLSVPLHNLTTNEYMFSPGETLIAVEFTKLSKSERWVAGSGTEFPQRVSTHFYTPYPQPDNPNPKSTERNVVTQVVRAEAHRPIRSTVATTVAIANSALDRVNGFGWIAAIGALIGLGSIALSLVGLAVSLFGVYRVIGEARESSRAASASVAHQDSLRQQLKHETDSTRLEISLLKHALAGLKASVDSQSAGRSSKGASGAH